jgi:sugar phosphate isomerase/epimerase
VRFGTTLFSFTNEWLSRRWTLEHMLARVAELGLGPGLELVGFQTFRGYPALDAEAALDFRRQLDRHGLEPAAIAGYVDWARRADRMLTADEAVELLGAQVVAARALGFPVVRLHTGIPADVIERVLPIAEHAEIVLATEVQGPQSPEHPDVAAVLECHERLDSPSLGLLLDFSVAMTELPRAFAAALRRLGATAAHVDAIRRLWEAGAPPYAALELDLPAAARTEAISGLVRFGRQDPRGWLPLVPRVVHAHAKFWELDAAGGEPTVRNAELLAVLDEGGYDGFVSSEWGGSAWLDADEIDAFELVARHRALLEAAAVGAPVTGGVAG